LFSLNADDADDSDNTFQYNDKESGESDVFNLKVTAMQQIAG